MPKNVNDVIIINSEKKVCFTGH